VNITRVISRMLVLLEILAVGIVSNSHASVGSKTECVFRVLDHSMRARLYPARHRLEAVDKVSLKADGERCRKWRFRLNSSLQVDSIRVGTSKAVTFHRLEGAGETGTSEGGKEGQKHEAVWEVDLGNYNVTTKVGVVTVSYSGIINDTLKVPTFSREFIANQTTGLIGEKGVYLAEASGWYPAVPGELVPFSLEVIIPEEFEVVSQGKRAVDEIDGGLRRVRWESPHPTDVIYIVAGKWEVKERDVGPVKIYTYFFPKSRDLSDSYLSATERYIRMYSDLIGPYPYEKFAVVENFFESGYGMPSFTLLGSTVIRLPFIIYSSLGHEILHNWWGNSVFVDSTSGNWCESLTTYMADYYYKERKGEKEAREYRLEIDKAYSNYVNEENDFSLAEFASRTTPATRSVGYGKGAMVFHGIRRLIGDEAFYRALRRFFAEHTYAYATWSDLRAAFEKEGKMDLGWYFDQWIKGVGAPLIHLEGVRQEEGDPSSVTVTLAQEGQGAPYRLDVPVVVETRNGAETHNVRFSELRQSFSIHLGGMPVRLAVDPDYQVFRRMDSLEIPPSLSTVLGDENEIIVLPDHAGDANGGAYQDLLKEINRTGEARVGKVSEITQADLQQNSLFIFGGPGENGLWGRLAGHMDGIEVATEAVTLAGERYEAAGHSFLAVFRNPWDPARGVAVFFGSDPEDIRSAGRKLVHYGKYGYLAFEGGNNAGKGTWEVKNSPLAYRF